MAHTDDAWIGRQIGQYIIQSHIQKGGMADVYYAVDQGLDRPVALKILDSKLIQKDETFIRRFRREARAVARLRHPNIVQIYTTGMTPDNYYYIAMEYVGGGSLAEQLQTLSRQGQVLETKRTLYIVRQVASALAAAHRAGIIHRDIKPSNILLRADGEPVLTDLGIAKMSSEKTITRTDELVGTPYYMSPEQVSSQPVDARSDLYSLGMIMYEMLTGKRPFTGNTPWEILSKHMTDTPRPVEELRPDISPSVALIVHTCLAKNPEDRYQSAEELVTALDGAMRRGGTVVVPPPSRLKTPPPAPPPMQEQQKKKRPFLPILLLVLLFLCLLLAGGAAAFGYPPVRARLFPEGVLVAAATAASTASPTETASATLPPTDTAVPTKTATPTKTPVPTKTATPTKTTTPTPTPTSTSAANPVGPGGSGGGLPLDFEAFGLWARGDEDNGTFTRSTARARSGSASGKLSYDFSTPDNDYVIFLQNNPVPGEPTALQVWVYGDGSGHYLNAWVQDREGQTWQAPFGRVTHTGWQQMTAYLDPTQDWPWQHISGPKNDTIEYPVTFRGFVLDDLNNAYTGSGDIYLDDLTAANLTLPGGGGSGSAPPATAAATSSASAPPPESVGRILYTTGDTLLTTDPAWSAPQELGTAASDTCSSPAATITGASYNLYFGNFCAIGSAVNVCASPNGAWEVVADRTSGQYVITTRLPGAENYTFVYQGAIDVNEGIRWSPGSDSFLFVVGDAVYRAFPDGSYNQIIPQAYGPIFSQDGSMILYLKPVGPGVRDVFVSGNDGSNARNVTNTAAIDKRCPAWRR
ncbi:MAG TPA: serine/threonine protein kinase [Chloroflexi bacterium]|nr:serine/threonine protein kinase [Chloroflexota bacterium]